MAVFSFVVHNFFAFNSVICHCLVSSEKIWLKKQVFVLGKFVRSRVQERCKMSFLDFPLGLETRIRTFNASCTHGFHDALLVVSFPTIVFLGVPSFTEINGSSAG